MKFTLTLLFVFIASVSFSQTTTTTGEKFSKIVISGNARILIKQDSVCSVTYKQGDNASDADARIKNDTYEVSGIASDEIMVTLPVLNALVIDGHGSITGAGSFTTDNLNLKIPGSGKITLDVTARKINGEIDGFGKMILSGSTQDATFSIAGSGKIDAISLKTIRCNSDVSGIGKITVDAIDELNVKISGSGNVAYKNTPKSMNQDISGIGKVKSATAETFRESKDVDFNTDTTKTVSDTTRFDFGKNQVWVIGKMDNFKEKRRRAKPIWAGFEMGINSWVDNSGSFNLANGLEDFELREEKCTYVGLNFFEKDFELGHSNVWFFTGLGITWNNYRFDNDVVLVNGDYTTTYRDTSPGVDHVKSKLVVSYLTAPVMFEFFTDRRAKKAFHLGVGGMLGMRIGSHTKRKIIIDSESSKLKEFDDFNLDMFRYGFRAQIGYGKFNVFADYYASSVFNDHHGPKLFPIDVGITLIGF